MTFYPLVLGVFTRTRGSRLEGTRNVPSLLRKKWRKTPKHLENTREKSWSASSAHSSGVLRFQGAG